MLFYRRAPAIFLPLFWCCFSSHRSNYSLSLGCLLTFLLAGMGGIAMFHTFRNLVQLAVQSG
jgi:hypothetical protein